MIKMLGLGRRRPDMTLQEHFAYREHVHGGLARKYRGTIQKYVQGRVYDSAFGYQPDGTYKMEPIVDCVTELYYENFATMAENFQDPNVAKYVAGDGAKMCDEKFTITMVVEEQPVIDKGEGGFKILFWLKKPSDMEIEEFYQEIDNANAEILPSIPGIIRYIKNVPTGAFKTNHFNNDGSTTYEFAASIWVDSMDTFRDYHKQMVERTEKQLFFDPSYSFFICVDEVYII